MRRTRLLVAVSLLLGMCVAALILPLPTPVQIRDWTQSVGLVAPLLFLAGHALITVAPVPRTMFTLAAGLLFGPLLGVVLSLAATTLSAFLAFALVRRLGRDLVAPHLDRGLLRGIDARLRHRGWLAVAALRLIPAVPFSALNYCSAVSSIRLWQFLAGTVGAVPGSVAVVVLGDALTGTTSPGLLAISLGCAAVGVIALMVDARLRVPDPAADPAAEPAADPTG